MQVIEVIEAFDLDRYDSRVVGYVIRHKRKNGLEDLKKARWYLNRKIARMEAAAALAAAPIPDIVIAAAVLAAAALAVATPVTVASLAAERYQPIGSGENWHWWNVNRDGPHPVALRDASDLPQNLFDLLSGGRESDPNKYRTYATQEGALDDLQIACRLLASA